VSAALASCRNGRALGRFGMGLTDKHFRKVVGFRDFWDVSVIVG
jgi:hypothetical protein